MNTKKVTHPCPLCGAEMNAHIDILAQVGGTRYTKVNVNFSCSNNDCRYKERTRGHSHNEETLQRSRDLIAGFRGPAMFPQGRFEEGSVGINRRRHTGIGRFERVELPKGKRGKG